MLDSIAARADNSPRRDSTSGEARTIPKQPSRKVPDMPGSYSIRYERGQRTLIHRPFSENILEQVNYALWFDAPEVT